MVEKWYQKTWFTILMLIFFWPVGLFLMWKYRSTWKKAAKIIVTVIFVIGLIAVIVSPSDTKDSAKEVSQEETVQEVSNPLLKAKIKTEDVISGTGDVVGTYAFIKFDKSEASKLTEEQFAEFTNKKVKDSDYNYFAIDFGDGTGIHYAGGNTEIVSYGKLDKDLCLSKDIGFIKLTDGKYIYEEKKEETEPEPTPDPKPTPTPEPTSEPKTTPAPEPEVSLGQKNALAKAKDYLAYTAFSYSGLIKQLEFEGFSTEDATYAVDNCGADWNEQAAAKAQEYLDYTSFSRDGLIEQLEYEGFSYEEAEYGVSAVGY